MLIVILIINYFFVIGVMIMMLFTIFHDKLYWDKYEMGKVEPLLNVQECDATKATLLIGSW